MHALREELANAQSLHDLAPEDWRRWWDRSGASELRCIVMTSWDVLGVMEFGIWDEYDAYLVSVGNRLRLCPADRAVSEIVGFLSHVQLDFIGMSTARPELHRDAATTIVGWYGWSRERDRVPPLEK